MKKKRQFPWKEALITLTTLFTLLGGLGIKVSNDRVAIADSNGDAKVLNRRFLDEERISHLEAANKALRAKLFKKCKELK